MATKLTKAGRDKAQQLLEQQSDVTEALGKIGKRGNFQAITVTNDHNAEYADVSLSAPIAYNALEQQRAALIAAAPDHALFASAVCSGVARWEPFPNNNGEVCVGGLRYAVKLDEFGCPVINAPLRAALSKATGAQT